MSKSRASGAAERVSPGRSVDERVDNNTITKVNAARLTRLAIPVSITIKNVRDLITDRLREEIMTGKFKAGEPLREIPLAERFDVSRGPIRDAILQLTQEGLLVAQPNKGVKIADTWDETLRPLMSELRFKIESIAVSELLKKDNPGETLEALKQNLRLFELACRDEDMPSVVQLDLEFHRIILRNCGHHGLESVWLPLMGGIRLPYHRHTKMIESHAEHKAIYEAIETGDSDRAIEAIRQNVLPA